VFRIVKELAADGTTILLVEQLANLALDVADRAYVLETGTITAGGMADEVARDPRVVAAYLGA
jgi:branched-chain amino acid transport system ATP-binding protein